MLVTFFGFSLGGSCICSSRTRCHGLAAYAAQLCHAGYLSADVLRRLKQQLERPLERNDEASHLVADFSGSGANGLWHAAHGTAALRYPDIIMSRHTDARWDARRVSERRDSRPCFSKKCRCACGCCRPLCSYASWVRSSGHERGHLSGHFSRNVRNERSTMPSRNLKPHKSEGRNLQPSSRFRSRKTFEGAKNRRSISVIETDTQLELMQLQDSGGWKALSLSLEQRFCA